MDNQGYGCESFLLDTEENQINFFQTNEPPSEKEIHATMPCKFSCCRDEQHFVDTFMTHMEMDDEEKNYYDNFFFIPTPKTTVETKNKDLIPTTMMIIRSIQKQTSGRLLRILFDSGSGKTMINKSSLPKGCVPQVLEKPISNKTIEGTFTTQRRVHLDSIILPEFDRSLTIDTASAFVFDDECRYDIIVGRDILTKAGMILDFSKNRMTWLGRTVLMKTPEEMVSPTLLTAFIDEDDFFEEEEEYDSYLTIAPADYREYNLEEIAKEQTHLTKQQQQELQDLLSNYTKLFSGELGLYEGEKVHLEINQDATPKHARPYSIPRTQLEVFKNELDHLIKIGVLSRVGKTEWASPTFIIPKKDGKVRWITDFRELNKVIKRRVYPLPNIQEVLTKRTGYEFFTKLDISMCYYTFELDDESKELCTIVTPFGKYKYNRLAMGLSVSPDVCQEIMENIFRDVEDCDVFIDDIGNFSKSWKDHLLLLNKVLSLLQDNGFTVNPRKCEWAVKETDWLGYWLTPTGLKPWKKKVDAILKMDRPRNTKQLKSFLGAVNFYRDMWPRRSHVLRPLTDLTGKGAFKWTDSHEQAFQAMKALMAKDVFCAYPDPNKPFEIYTDASDYQLGAAILQQGKPVAYYSKKLNKAQQNYSTYEKELLAITATLNAFRSMLLGTNITVYTDHKNLTYKTINNRRVLNWRLDLEDFGATYLYLPGKDNVLADAFSRLPRMDSLVPRIEGKSAAEESFFADPELLDCFLNLPEDETLRNPIDLEWIQTHQANDNNLILCSLQQPQEFPIKTINNRPMICKKLYVNDEPQDWKICIPDALLTDMIRWYHLVLGHAGKTRLYDAIRKIFYHPRLKYSVDNYKCSDCQLYKQAGRAHGQLPMKEAILIPFEEVHIDLIGPWTVEVQGKEIEIKALTCIEPVTNLVELIRIDNKTAKHVAQQFSNVWLARYPWPERCIHDNGGEFIGHEFQQLLERTNIKDVPTTAYNPQGNAQCERMHQTVGNVLRTYLHGRTINDEDELNTIVEAALATAMHATRTNVSRSLHNSSPGSLVYHRDMFLNLPFEADLLALHQLRQQKINTNLLKQNKKRWNFDYEVGQQVLVKSKDGRKLDPPFSGPYPIVQVYSNGTVAIQRAPNVRERINIRRITPHKL